MLLCRPLLDQQPVSCAAAAQLKVMGLLGLSWAPTGLLLLVLLL
jgi:hypothetical protein